ncbi:MAG: redoxin domain-containing protein [bacterium]|nr:redoxin domain-containing protein [bacterium]
MSLQTRLDRIRTNFEKDAPPEALAVMHQAAADLKASNIMEGVFGEGQQAPAFTLEDSRDRSTSLASLRLKGPVVLTFFRGDW